MEEIKGKSFFGKLIDGDIENVAVAVEDLSYTRLLNLKKQLEMQYVRLQKTKNEIYKKIEEEEVDNDKGLKTIDEIYVAMQKIEDIASIVETIKDGRSLDEEDYK